MSHTTPGKYILFFTAYFFLYFKIIYKCKIVSHFVILHYQPRLRMYTRVWELTHDYYQQIVYVIMSSNGVCCLIPSVVPMDSWFLIAINKVGTSVSCRYTSASNLASFDVIPLASCSTFLFCSSNGNSHTLLQNYQSVSRASDTSPRVLVQVVRHFTVCCRLWIAFSSVYRMSCPHPIPVPCFVVMLVSDTLLSMSSVECTRGFVEMTKCSCSSTSWRLLGFCGCCWRVVRNCSCRDVCLAWYSNKANSRTLTHASTAAAILEGVSFDR